MTEPGLGRPPGNGPRALGSAWFWVGEPRSAQLRREGVLVALVAGLASVLTLVLLLVLGERLPAGDQLGDFYLLFGLLAPFSLLITSVSGLLVLRWVRDGYVSGDGASRLEVGPTMAAPAALLALIGTAISAPPAYGQYSLVTLPALVIVVAVSAMFFVRFRGTDV